MNTVGYFEIHSSHPPREITFYETVFKWKFIKEEFVPIEYYRIETNGINGGLLKRQLKFLHRKAARMHLFVLYKLIVLMKAANWYFNMKARLHYQSLLFPEDVGRDILQTRTIISLGYLKLMKMRSSA